ncbi:class I SAM-dependent methyltransferase [Nocardioides sp. GCM10027113]|uniref:class I SAM-dependent methyltransferase n=1 Tax=unclassified Nocardioides TaxID=2615069 RepID=UPI0036189580
MPRLEPEQSVGTRRAPAVERWPDLVAPPRGPRAAVASRIARRLFLAAVGRLHVTVHLEGETLGMGGPAMTVRDPEEFFGRIGRDGLIGFGEGYMTGAWEADDLAAFLTVLASDIADLVPRRLQRLRAFYVAKRPHLHRNTEDNTRSNIAHHYDLSNDLFRLFLDETLSYSSALFPASVIDRDDHLAVLPPEDTDDLAAAQGRKIERLLDDAGVGEGSRVLEIGTGWGELAIRAARRGATVHSITLSTEQQALARRRIAEAGFADRVEVELCDYRAVQGEYDAVVSVEMIEAVGAEYWSTYFATIDRVLAPGGKVAIQAILMPHDRMVATQGTHTWITKYIFPGGMLPSVEAIDQVTREDTTLRLTGRTSFGLHYAETLRIWDERFRAASPQVRALGFDETFERMWHFYLEYSRAGFASGYLDVQQLVLTRDETGEGVA